MRIPDVTIERFAAWRPVARAPTPDVSFVPPLLRRRLTLLERASVMVARAVYPQDVPPEGIPVVFASRWGEIATTLKLMIQFFEEGEMSPAGFACSVHNAAPGIFSLLMKNRADYTAVAARDRTLYAGLAEALSRRTRAIFVYAEEATPDFYRPAFGVPVEAGAVAVRLDARAWKGRMPPLSEKVTLAPFISFLEGRGE